VIILRAFCARRGCAVGAFVVLAEMKWMRLRNRMAAARADVWFGETDGG
jgi:hypothetical protein